jgi:hypothetical protein
MKTIKPEDANFIEDEFGAFEDEVLNAGWVPPLENPALACYACPDARSAGGQRRDRETTPAAEETPVFDVDAFLNQVYSNQGF